MSLLMQSRASYSNGKAVGIDGISAEVLKSIPCRVLQKSSKAFEMRYLRQNKEEIESWLGTSSRLEGQTRGIWVQGVLAKWYCGCFSTLLEMELRKFGKRDISWGSVHTLGFEEGRSSTEISTSIRLVAAAAREWGPELGFITCSLDVKQAFDNVAPLNWSLEMKEMNIAPVLAGAIFREQIGGKCDICFQETRISSIPLDRSIRQGGKESPCLFNLMMKSIFRKIQREWDGQQLGVKMSGSEEERMSHMIF